jgi:hypothetical protein
MDVYRCAHCGATGLMARMDDLQCLTCGNLTDFASGKAKPTEPQFDGGPTAFERRPQ